MKWILGLLIGLSVAIAVAYMVNMDRWFANEAQLLEAAKLNETVIELCRSGKHFDAIPLAERELSIRERTFGSDHTLVAESLVSARFPPGSATPARGFISPLQATLTIYPFRSIKETPWIQVAELTSICTKSTPAAR
jgi:hypothetical protein